VNNIILELDFILQSVGTVGIVIFYFTLAKLSALMGRGLRLGSYHLWYYIAIIITLLTIPIHLYLHLFYAHSLDAAIDLQGLYVSFLLLSNSIVIIVSIKYWWWLKNELLG